MSPPPTSPTQPTLQCDLVMKGGITSGVVYPRAVVRVARDYRIRNIGGTSVGAIAAALTAAAEYWRQSSPDTDAVATQQGHIEDLVNALNTERDGSLGWNNRTREDVTQADATLLSGGEHAPGFAGLYAIPAEIGKDLLGKFQPIPSTAGAFNYLIAILEAKQLLVRLMVALSRQFHILRLLTAIVVGLFTLAFVNKPSIALWAVAGIAAFGILVVGYRRVHALINPTHHAPVAKIPTAVKSPLARLPLGHIGLGILAVLWAAYVQRGIGWNTIASWLFHHWPVIPALILVGILLTQGDRLREDVIARYPGPDPATTDRRRHLLELASLGIGLLLAAVLIVDMWDASASEGTTFAVITCGVVAGWILGAFVGLVLNALIFIPRNYNGLCTGMGNPNALTPWLGRKINTVAGLPPEGPPLTIGMLRNLPQGKRISFEAIASDVTRGLPIDLPSALHRYAFRVDEFRQFFPETVLTQLGVTASTPANAYLPFPHENDIPLVMLARMSMSFPVLFSAVPVYFVPTTGAPRTRCLLSDGGIVSNFPIHKFDRSLSPWPTFAIDLLEESGNQPPNLKDQIWTSPIQPTSTPSHIEEEAAMIAVDAIPDLPTDSLPTLASRILNTARGWMDNSQKQLPGYRERIVGIRLYPGEGGLNLSMPATTIDTLAHRGMFGLHTLVESWHPEPDLAAPNEPNLERWARSQWHQHRWLRYRIMMRSLENIGQEWNMRYELPDGNAPSIADLVATADEPPENERPVDMVYGWTYGVNGMQAANLTRLFHDFARATPRPADPEAPNLTGIFDGPVAPEIEPRLLMMPPFE